MTVPSTICGSSTPPPGNLAVTVSRSDTNALLSGATVTLSGGPSSPPDQPTGGDGTTTFSNLAVGNYTVRASLAEFQTNSASATVVANTPTPVAVSLTPSQELTPPPARVETSVDTTCAPTPGDKAVVITHGWRDNASSWVAEMAKDICTQLGFNGSVCPVKENFAVIVCQVNGWDVWAYDWRTKAQFFPGWELVVDWETLNFEIVGEGLRPPWDVYINAISLGREFADILKGEDYQHIHFIAHSDGASLIEYATRGLKNSLPTLKIHETFLDAYAPSNELELIYGERADWADNYFDRRNVTPLGALDTTKIRLSKAYNFDVTPYGWVSTISEDCGFVSNLDRFHQWSCRHSRPFRFYGFSIDPNFVIHFSDYQFWDPIGGTAERGYPLSVEKGRTLGTLGELGTLSNIFPPGGICYVQGEFCYPDNLPPSMWSLQILLPSYVEVTQQVATFYVESVLRERLTPCTARSKWGGPGLRALPRNRRLQCVRAPSPRLRPRSRLISS